MEQQVASLVGMLHQLREWCQATDSCTPLLSADEYEHKRAEVVAEFRLSDKLPLSLSAARQVLETLCLLGQQGYLTPTELTTLKHQVLQAVHLHPPPPVPSPAAAGRGRRKEKENKEKESTAGGLLVDHKYFGYYADFAHQELMLNDSVRTGTYHQAFLQNRADFAGKVVVDVGTGTGVLAMFACVCGARRVYAIEASAMAATAEKAVAHNGMAHVITVIRGKVEEVQIDDTVDVLISEPLGFWLLNEQMIQSYVVARDRWLRPHSKESPIRMFPTYAELSLAPCYLPEVRQGAVGKAASWLWKAQFYGLDFTCVEADARTASLSRVIVDQILPHQVRADPSSVRVDFRTATVAQLNSLTAPLEFHAHSPASKVLWDSVGIWFDTYFVGSQDEKLGTTPVCLYTAPEHPLTCWYQSLCLLPEARMDTDFTGYVEFQANAERTYDLDLCELVEGGEEDGLPEVVWIQQYSFLQPVYRYYEHFADLQWNIGTVSGSSLPVVTTTTTTATTSTAAPHCNGFAVAGSATANGLPAVCRLPPD